MILEAAARVLEKDGLAGYNTNAIAQRAGVSIGSVYQYFPNKDALTMGLIAKFEHELLENVRAAAAKARGKDLQGSLKLMVRALIETHRSRAVLNRVLELEEDRLRHNSADHTAARELESILASLLRKHRAKLKVAVSAATVQDLITMTRAMVDATLIKDTPRIAEEHRIFRAIISYLLYEGSSGMRAC